MKRLAGQAGRTLGGFVHLCGIVLMTLLPVAALALGALACRLAQAPLEIPWITARLANAVSGQDIRIDVGQAALGWGGYRKGGGAPLFLQLGRIVVRNAAGVQVAAIGTARVALTPGRIFSPDAAIYVTSSDARFAGAEVPVGLLAGIHLGRGFKLTQARIWVTLGPGALGPPGMAWPLQGGKFLLGLAPEHVTLTDGQLTLTRIGGSAPVIGFSGDALRKGGRWRAILHATGTQVQAQDLPHYWPPQLAPPQRGWITTHITAGTAYAPDFTVTLSASPRLAGVSLENAAGRFRADHVSLIWMPGAPPITGLAGSFTLAGLDEIDLAGDRGALGGIALSHAGMRIEGVAHARQTATLHVPVSGTLAAVFGILGAPALNLLKSVPAPVLHASGEMTGTVDAAFPLKGDLAMADVTLKIAASLRDAALALPAGGLALDAGALDLTATAQGLVLAGSARLAGQRADLGATARFEPGAGSLRFDMKTAVTDKTLARLGLDPAAILAGVVPVELSLETTPFTTGMLTIGADLTPASLQLPLLGWRKPAGKAGVFDLSAGIAGPALSGIGKRVTLEAHAPGLDIESQAQAGGVNLSRVHIGDTEAAGRIVWPKTAGSPWQFDFFGSRLDASKALNPAKAAVSGIAWRATAHFDQLRLAGAPAPGLDDFNFEGDGQGGSIVNVTATGTLVSGQPVDLAIRKLPGARARLRLQTRDGGELLRLVGAYPDLAGGVLDFDASYAAAGPLTGAATLTGFRMKKAPGAAKLLEAITVLGLPAAALGPGMEFHKLIAPFSMQHGVMTLKDARAYSAALGVTASGRIDLTAGNCDIRGTVVPDYALNTLPGRIPVIGRLFSPEKGGGLIAIRYAMTGPTRDPLITVNPLSALTPGFLREIFGIGDKLEGR